jgi:trk system potassium uptake protein TrkA
MRIIIAGAGEVGTHLAKMLAPRFMRFLIIDPEEERLRPIEASMDCPYHSRFIHIGKPS